MNLKDNLMNNVNGGVISLSETEIKNRVETTISKSFMWMGAILLLAFGIGFYMSTSGISVGPIGYFGSIILGLGIILYLSFKWQTLSYNVIAGLLLLFGVLEGIGLSVIFTVYSLGSVYSAFLTTSVMFFLLSIAGYYIKIDITKWGTILMVGIIALLIGFLINMFVMSSEFNVWLNIIGIIIFSGFIIYDMNVLKQMSVMGDNRLELIMALGLFLNFINIFLMLLNLMGSNE